MNRLTTMRAAAAALLLAGVQFAHAHAFPTHQAPSAGETVTASPPRVAIDFDDGLEPAFSSIAVTDAQGRAVTNGKGEVDASNRKHMSVALNPLAPGVYTVAWVARARDGHPPQGANPVTVNCPDPRPRPTTCNSARGGPRPPP
ncbi:copper resistance CopC family protein, partial [Burkholderia contaminans]|uniref:copper resistance CopC family protein n=1 Tax=Burkholderia contaminans TaxID=488447 RepID=UPI001C93A95A|nr:copper resistance protein CopC [Burkholderia contaminans]